MLKRKIINIDEEKCNGCSLCIPNCPEGAIQIIDGKARLISDLFCDGLGACIGHCPENAITIEEREAEPYDEKKVMENIVKCGENTIKAHLNHLNEHNEKEFLKQALGYLKDNNIKIDFEKYEVKEFQSCPGSRMLDLRKKNQSSDKEQSIKQDSELSQWPIQLNLVSPNAPYFNDCDLLIAADCVPFAYANFHSEFLKGKTLIIGCPKLDDSELYLEKLTEIIKKNNIKSITIANMEVPCCFGLQKITEDAIKNSNKIIPLRQHIITISGDK